MFDFDTPEKEKTIELPAALAKVDTKGLNQNISPVVAQVTGLIITSPEECDSAVAILKDIKGSLKLVTDKFKPSVSKANEAHKAVKAVENEFSDKLKEAEQIIKNKVSKFITRYLYDERKEQIDSQSELKEQINDLQIKADAARNEGNVTEAEKLDLEIQSVILANIDSEGYKPPKGVSLKDAWEIVVVEKKDIPLEYMEPNLKAIQKVVAATKGVVKIPGITAVPKKVIAIRA